MHKPQATLPPLRKLRVITCRVTLDVPLQLMIKFSDIAPSANVTDMEAKVGSTGLGVMTAVASPARRLHRAHATGPGSPEDNMIHQTGRREGSLLQWGRPYGGANLVTLTVGREYPTLMVHPLAVDANEAT